MSATRLTLAPGLTCKFNCSAPSLSVLNFIGEAFGIWDVGTFFDIAVTVALVDLQDFEDIKRTLVKGMIPVIFMDQGSALIFLNGPNDRLEFSLNGVFGRTSSKFEGIHSIPVNSGVHFTSYRVNSGSEGAFVTLIFYPITPKVLVFEWCQQDELFKLKCETLQVDQDKLLQYPGLISYERFMSQEPGALSNWKRFTSFITKESIFTACYEAKITEELFEVTPMLESHHSLLKEINAKSPLGPVLKFIEIPTLKAYVKLVESDLKQITRCAMDKSAIFYYLNCNFGDLFAQLQLSFLLLVFAQNFEGFEQWFDIVSLLLESFEVALRHPKQYQKLFKIIEDHFEMCPDDFFTGLMNENKLYKLLNSFFIITNGEFEQFKQLYEIKFGWKFDDESENDEDAPVIVE